jgi:hypothetical protein
MKVNIRKSMNEKFYFVTIKVDSADARQPQLPNQIADHLKRVLVKHGLRPRAFDAVPEPV